MLERVLEPEAMDSAAEAADYNAMDHSEVNRVFVDDLMEGLWSGGFPPSGGWKVFDAGTGTALIPIELVRRGIEVKILAGDLAEEMLSVARRNVASAGFTDSIEVVQRDCKKLEEEGGSFDVVMSNSIVHHIPEPLGALRECLRILKPGGLLFVRDLARPNSEEELKGLVEQYGGTRGSPGWEMFRDSLRAALTAEEVGGMLEELGVARSAVAMTSDRHWTVSVRKVHG